MKEYKETIRFTHTDGKEYVFKTEPNPFNNNQMWWFEPQCAMYAGTVSEAKTIAKNLRRKNETIFSRCRS